MTGAPAIEAPGSDRAGGPCGECRQLDPAPFASGVRYCRRLCVWRWPGLTVDCDRFEPGLERVDSIVQGVEKPPPQGGAVDQ